MPNTNGDRLRQIQQIAEQFDAILRETIGDALYRECIDRNRNMPAGVCATHDYCDANMVCASMSASGIDDKNNCNYEIMWNDAWNLWRQQTA
jgi:hypothetical protein